MKLSKQQQANLKRYIEAENEKQELNQWAYEILKPQGYTDKDIEAILKRVWQKRKIEAVFEKLPGKAKRAFFAKLQGGKVPGKRVYPIDPQTGKRKAPFGSASDMADLDNEFGFHSGASVTDSIRPSGRAPRGKGVEYANRRKIANAIDNNQRNLSKLQNTVDNYRGTKSGRYNISRARERIPLLRQSIDAALTIAESPGDWDFKKDLIDELFSYVSVTSA